VEEAQEIPKDDDPSGIQSGRSQEDMGKDVEMAIRNKTASPFCSKLEVVQTEGANFIRQFHGAKSHI
jgi:hypothetical protein